MSDRIYNETLRYGFSTPIVYETYRSADYGAAFLLPIGHVIGSNSYPSYLFQCDAQSLRPVAPR
jgi:hypothetical protein